MRSNKSIIEKTDISVSQLSTYGGYLNPMQANVFIRLLIDQPTLLNEIRVVPMNAPRMEINKIGFTSRILRGTPGSGSALAAADRAAPTTDKVTLTTEEVIAEIHIPYDVIEDNIERGSLEDTIMALLAERSALDLEELLILGDETSSDDFLASASGILKQVSTNLVDYSAAPVAISKTIFKDGLKAMPNKYLRNRAAMRFYVSPDVETEFADSLANRQTPFGDAKVTGWQPNYAYGVMVKPAALMPNAQAILTYPKNIIMGVQRQIMLETDRDIRARVLIIVLTMRLDIAVEQEDACVKIKGLEPNVTTTTTTTSP